MRPRQHVTRRTRQILAPENGGGIEDEIILGARIDGSGPLLRLSSANQGGSLANDFQSGDIARRISMILPADKSGDPIPLLHSGTSKHPMLGIRANPVSPSVNGFNIAGTDQIAFIWTTMRKGAIQFLSQLGIRVLATIGTTPEQNAICPTIDTVTKGAHPTDGISRKEQQIHTRIPEFDHAFILAEIPIFIVADTQERLAL